MNTDYNETTKNIDEKELAFRKVKRIGRWICSTVFAIILLSELFVLEHSNDLTYFLIIALWGIFDATDSLASYISTKDKKDFSNFLGSSFACIVGLIFYLIITFRK